MSDLKFDLDIAWRGGMSMWRAASRGCKRDTNVTDVPQSNRNGKAPRRGGGGGGCVKHVLRCAALQ